MNCYKCGSDKDLSIRAQRKSTGYKMYMCKSCRNAASKEYKDRKRQILLISKPVSIKPDKYIAWIERSNKSLSSISKRFKKVGA